MVQAATGSHTAGLRQESHKCYDLERVLCCTECVVVGLLNATNSSTGYQVELWAVSKHIILTYAKQNQ